MAGTRRIGLTGDVMLGRTVDERQRRRPPEAVWGTVLDRLRDLDATLVNLECCLSTRGTRWTRTYRPFHFRADPRWAIPALETAGVDCCALANNHVLDFGEVALEDTLDHLDAAGIAHAGAGRDLDAALEPARVTIDGLDVAVVSLTDNTPEYAATADAPGTAHVEIDVENERTRRRAGEALSRASEPSPDLLVASLHWGPNMVTEPPPAFEAFARWLVDRGVDLIHGHSAHVFHGIEVYDGAPILYDAGDFVDDYAVDPDLRNDRSFLFEVRADAAIEEVRLHPTEIRDYRVHEARGDAARWCRERVRDRSKRFDTEFEREGEALVLEV
ncbi:CapA family protein [Halomarina pelagica]|uniref:CapA family protein n=1 Tax=Halomarina pelagica TaxID=2961599 RepID=UPI0020C332C7|nr:CapA family protein [Halomarina sp. BND7]